MVRSLKPGHTVPCTVPRVPIPRWDSRLRSSAPAANIETIVVTEAVATQRYQCRWKSSRTFPQPISRLDDVQMARPSQPDKGHMVFAGGGGHGGMMGPEQAKC